MWRASYVRILYRESLYFSVAHQTKFDINHLVFAPNSRNAWHIHPDAEQVLLILDGEGYYQEEGQEVIRIKEGDVVRTPANVNIGTDQLQKAG